MAQPAPAPLRLGFLASHAGTTLAHVLDACASGALAAEARIVISNNSGAGALAIARERGVPARHISALSEGSAQAEQRAIARHLVGAGCELVVLAGYMKRLGSAVLDAFPDRLVNVHPAVLPDFGGRGMFGG
ncbi:MAG: formyltransferase family protein, partial [Acidimicrobiales bacterium]